MPAQDQHGHPGAFFNPLIHLAVEQAWLLFSLLPYSPFVISSRIGAGFGLAERDRTQGWAAPARHPSVDGACGSGKSCRIIIPLNFAFWKSPGVSSLQSEFISRCPSLTAGANGSHRL